MPDQTLQQLAELIDEHSFQAPSYSEEAAAAVLKAGWRPPAQRITDPDDLDALPVRTVIVDDWETVWRRGETSWFACDRHPDAPARIVLPATVLHTPRNGDSR